MAYDFLEGLMIGAAVFSLLFVFIIWLLVKYLANRLFSRWAQERLKKEVAKSLDIQRPIIKGKISEQLFPLLSNRIGDLSDLRFIGDPVDYVYFKGLSEAREGKIKDIDIRFIEVKSGEATISKAEEFIKGAVKDKRVTWEEIRL